jgi:hypothetical protein
MKKFGQKVIRVTAYPVDKIKISLKTDPRFARPKIRGSTERKSPSAHFAFCNN